MRPMLASAGDHVPTGPGWSHEVKWDGMRVLAHLTDDGLRLTSRNENVVTPAWPDLTLPARRLQGTALSAGDGLLLDGEVIGLDPSGRPDFRVLAERIHVRAAGAAARWAEKVPATFMVFDVLRSGGTELVTRPLAERRAELEQLAPLLAEAGWQVPGAYDDGVALHTATAEQGLEGIVSKRLDSPYRPGERSRAWLKFPHRLRGSYVVGGWRPQVGTADRLASLLVGEWTAQGWQFRGRVGSGISTTASRTLAAAVAGLTRSTSPFCDEVPAVDARGTTWVEPVLVVDVESLGAGGGRLRQPSYQGVRADLSAHDLTEGVGR